MVGVVLLVVTLGMAFTGQVLRFDQDAYWGLGIVASIAGRMPLIGGQLVQLVLGGPIIAGETLSRFFALHVFVIPALLHRVRRPAPAHGAEARHQRMADARAARRQARRTSRSTRRWSTRTASRSCPVAFQKDLVFAGSLIAGGPLLRRRLRSLRPGRRARSDDHPDRPPARLLLPLDLLDRGAAAAEDRDLRSARRDRRSRSSSCWCSRSGREWGRRAGAAGRSRCWS